MRHRPWIARLVVALAPLSGCARATVPVARAAESPLHNLGLERYTPEGYPVAWYVEAEAGEGAKRGDVTIRPDTMDRREGARSLRVANTGEGPVVIYTPLLPGARCVTDVAVTAAVRTRDSARVAPFLLLPGSGRPDVGPPAPGTDRWETARHRWTGRECLREDVVFGLLITGAARCGSTTSR